MSYYHQIPDEVTHDGLRFHEKNALYAYLSKPLIDDLAVIFAGKRVLEVYAGRGYLSALLREKGVDIRATSLQQGHDGSQLLGYVHEVEPLDAESAIHHYSGECDFILTAWPTTDGGLARSLRYVNTNTLIVFIGEITDYNVSPAFLGGCATDEFFEGVVEIPEMTKRVRYPTPRMDKLKVYRVA